MLGSAKTATVKVDSDSAHKLVGELFLRKLVKVTLYAGVIKLTCLGYSLDKRNYAGFERGEELVAFFHRQTVLVFTEAVIVRLFFRCAVLREFSGGVKYLFEYGAEHIKVALLLGSVPDVVRLDHKLLIRDIFVHRYLLHFLYVAHGYLDYARILCAKLVLVGVEKFKHGQRFLARRELVGLLAQNGERVSSVVCRALRRDGRAVVVYKRHSVSVRAHFGLPRVKRSSSFVKCHVCLRSAESSAFMLICYIYRLYHGEIALSTVRDGRTNGVEKCSVPKTEIKSYLPCFNIS